MLATYDKIIIADDRANAARVAYLTRFGWKETCNTPGAIWLWQRDFADIDQQRLAWWDGISGPYGRPSKPVPMGVITANMVSAIGMTRAVLDTEDDVEHAGAGASHA